jgi:oligoendopeptidase F
MMCISDEKLNNLDAMYSNRHDDLASMHNLSTEEKLLLFQKNIELRTQANLKQQVNKFYKFLRAIGKGNIYLDGSISRK